MYVSVFRSGTCSLRGWEQQVSDDSGSPMVGLDDPEDFFKLKRFYDSSPVRHRWVTEERSSHFQASAERGLVTLIPFAWH